MHMCATNVHIFKECIILLGTHTQSKYTTCFIKLDEIKITVLKLALVSFSPRLITTEKVFLKLYAGHILGDRGFVLVSFSLTPLLNSLL